MSGELFEFVPDPGALGALRVALDTYVAGLEAPVPAPMVEHARILADVLDAEHRTNRAWAAVGRPLPSGTLMAQCQVSREFRDTFAALHKAAGGGDDDPASRLLAELAAPLVGDTARP
jgi:hypothetical protein